jgi:hypothetical protein
VKFYGKNKGLIDLDINNLPLYGNILIQFKTVGSISNSNMFRTTFNTAFIGKNNFYEVNHQCISPESLHKDFTTFDPDFSVRFNFKDYCQGEIDSQTNEVISPPCRSHITNIDDICKDCALTMKNEI